jgi:hypothetical protein
VLDRQSGQCLSSESRVQDAGRQPSREPSGRYQVFAGPLRRFTGSDDAALARRFIGWMNIDVTHDWLDV